MNNINTAKSLLAAAGLAGLTLFALANHAANYLPTMGIVVSYLAALAVLGLAATDKGAGSRRLS